MDCFNSNELLNYAVSQGIINIEAVKDQIDMKKNKELLLKHPYSIWQGKNETKPLEISKRGNIILSHFI